MLSQSDWSNGSPKFIENMLDNIMGKLHNGEITAAPSASRWNENWSVPKVLYNFEKKSI